MTTSESAKPTKPTETGATRVAVANQKGGVGKTMVSINLAGACNELGASACLVDVDPQGNATEGLGFASIYEQQPPTMHDVVTDERYAVVSELVVEHEEMDLLPANIDMFQTEPELITAIQGRLRLRNALDALETERDYDLIVLDAPPHLGVLSDAALLGAGNIVIPALAESTSQRALDILFDQIETLEDNFDCSISELAVVANRVEPDGEAEEVLTWMETAFGGHIPVLEVRKRVALKRAWKMGVSTFAHQEACDMDTVFLELARAVADATTLTLPADQGVDA